MNLDENITAIIVADILGTISSTEKIILDSLLAGNPLVKARYDVIHKELSQTDEATAMTGYATAGQLIAAAKRRERVSIFMKWLKWLIGIGLIGWLSLAFR